MTHMNQSTNLKAQSEHWQLTNDGILTYSDWDGGMEWKQEDIWDGEDWWEEPTTIDKFRDDIIEVYIQEGVTELSNLFAGCRNLKRIVLPKSLVEIANYALQGCRNLKEIVFQNENLLIGNYAFRDTLWLRNQTDFVIIGDTLYEYRGQAGRVMIPLDVRKVSCGAFRNHPTVKEVLWNKDVAVIPDCCFQDCKQLHTINIPDGVSSIAAYAFDGCQQLEYISFPDSLENIAYCAFRHCCKLSKVTIPKKVTKLARSVFEDCTTLHTVVFKGNVSACSKNSFDNTLWKRKQQLRNIYLSNRMEHDAIKESHTKIRIQYTNYEKQPGKMDLQENFDNSIFLDPYCIEEDYNWCISPVRSFHGYVYNADLNAMGVILTVKKDGQADETIQLYEKKPVNMDITNIDVNEDGSSVEWEQQIQLELLSVDMYKYFDSLDNNEFHNLRLPWEHQARQQNAVSQYYLGMWYMYVYETLRIPEKLKDRERDKFQKTAMEWLLKSAKAQYAPAQCEYGVWYFKGFGWDNLLDGSGNLSSEYIEAGNKLYYWLWNSLSQKYGKAYLELGDYYTDILCSKDYDDEKAELCYRNAAKAGYKRACKILGDMYSGYVPTVSNRRIPKTIPKDMERAKFYYSKAQYVEGIMRISNEK